LLFLAILFLFPIIIFFFFFLFRDDKGGVDGLSTDGWMDEQ